MLNILTTGADGQLGSELRILAENSANNFIFTDIARLDITEADAVKSFVTECRPDVIINCAAYTDVERAEDDEQTAYGINCTAAENLAQAAKLADALLIHISTDYIFDGNSRTPYTEDMPAAPLNAYGRTKLAGEQAIIGSGCRYIILRTAWLYSGFGRNFLKTMLRLTAEKESVNVVSDQFGCPTYAADLAQAVFDIAESDSLRINQGVYHFTGEDECSWYDFACAIAAEAGNNGCKITPCRTEEFPSKAKRPAYSVLDNSKYKRTFGAAIPHWRESMRRCINRINNDSI